MSMRINWLGHSCFRIIAPNGKGIVMDPFDPTVGSLPSDLTADIVTVSHQHFDHNYIKAVKGKFSLVDSAGLHEFEGVRITGVPSWHDGQMGAKRGPNMIYIVEADGIKICHLGDLGAIPSKDELLRLEGIDMLLIPVGGTYTIGPEDADRLISSVKPRIAMPMHYSMEPGLRQLFPLERFTDGKAGVSYEEPGEYALEKGNGAKEPTKYLVLKPIS